MLAPMTRRLLRRGLGGTAMLIVGMMLFQFINPFIAKSLGGARGLGSLVEQLPPTMQALAQMSPEFLALTGLAGYLSRGYDHPVYYVLLISVMVGFAGRSIAGEVGSGTLALPLSRPIARSRIYVARVFGLVVLAVAIGCAGPVATWIGVRAADPAGVVSVGQLVAMAWLGMLLSWSVGGLALLVSSLSSTTGRVVGWATGFLVVSYFVDFFANLWSPLEPVQPFTLFAWFDTGTTMVDGQVPPGSVLVLGGTGVVAVAIGWYVFTRRDFEI